MSLVALLLVLFPGLLAPHQPCVVIASPMVACSNGHAYMPGPRGWQDVGETSPVVVLVPALPER